MPTANPRLTITLQPLLAAQLRRLSELTGNSQSKLISEILDGSTEVFARVIKVIEAAQVATAAMKGKAAADMDAAQTRIEAQLGIVMEEFDSFSGDLLKEAEKVTRRARKGATSSKGSAGGTVAVRGTSLATGTPARSARSGASTIAAVLTPLSNRGVRSVDNSHREKKAGKR